MRHKSFFLLLCGLTVLTSCAPTRVKNTITCFYPELPKDEYVPLFDTDGDVPSDSDLLGGLLFDGSKIRASELCDSVVVLNYLREEARRVGGNALAINYLNARASHNTNNDCHNIGVNVYRVHDFDSEPQSVTPYPAGKRCEGSRTYTRPMRRVATAFSLGRTNRLYSRGNTYLSYLGDDVKINWLALSGDVTYYVTRHLGLGVTYTCSFDDIFNGNYLRFIGLNASYRQPLGDGKWLLTGSVGGGYSLFSKVSRNETEKTSGLGYQLGINLEREILPNTGIVLGYHFSTGSIEKEDYPIAGSNNLNRRSITLGLRFMFD